MRSRKRARSDDTHQEVVNESDDHYQPSPKHSKMKSDRYKRDREENLRMREHRRSSPESGSRVTSRKTVRAQVS